MTEAPSEVKPSQGRWHRPAPRRWLRLAVPPGLSAVIYAGGVVLRLVTGNIHFHIVAAAGAAAVFLVQYWSQFLPKRARPADLRLLEDPDDPDVCLVEVSIFVDHAEIGRDRGVVWFEGGRLLFNGHRTSFALGGEDVMPQERWHELAWSRSYLPPHLVPLRDEARMVYVSFEPIRRGDGILMRQEMRFLGSLQEFRCRPPSSTGPRQLPPLER